MQTVDGYLLLGTPELSEQVFRVLQLKGDLPQLLDPRYQLGITVEDFTRAEYAYLRRTKLMTYRLSIAAGVGFPSIGQLTFPGPTIPYLGIVEQIVFNNPGVAAASYQVYFAAATVIASTSGGTERDDRVADPALIANPFGCGGFLAGVINTVAQTPPAAGALAVTVGPTSSFVLDVPWVIAENAAFTVATVANNTALDVSLIVRERMGQVSERRV